MTTALGGKISAGEGMDDEAEIYMADEIFGVNCTNYLRGYYWVGL